MRKFAVITLLLFLIGCSAESEKSVRIEELDYPEGMEVVKRSEWGWVPITKGIPEHKVNTITIHHGGVLYEKGKDTKQALKNLQAWGRKEKGWMDVPYHFIIDLEGNIYEGRPINYPGDTNTDYNPNGHALICVFGNYEVQEICEEQLNSVVKLSAFFVEKYGANPDEIKGHKDYTETLCPGKNLHKYIADGTIAARVKEELKKD